MGRCIVLVVVVVDMFLVLCGVDLMRMANRYLPRIQLLMDARRRLIGWFLHRGGSLETLPQHDSTKSLTQENDGYGKTEQVYRQPASHGTSTHTIASNNKMSLDVVVMSSWSTVVVLVECSTIVMIEKHRVLQLRTSAAAASCSYSSNSYGCFLRWQCDRLVE